MPFRIVRPWEKGLIERLGKFMRTANSGLSVVLPFVERMIKVDMREQVVDVPPQEVINNRLKAILDEATAALGSLASIREIFQVQPEAEDSTPRY